VAFPSLVPATRHIHQRSDEPSVIPSAVLSTDPSNDVSSAVPTMGSVKPSGTSSVPSSQIPSNLPIYDPLSSRILSEAPSDSQSSIPSFKYGPSITLDESNVPLTSLYGPPSKVPSTMASQNPTSSQSDIPTNSMTMNCEDGKDFRWNGKKKCNYRV
jgi:hypothetical protein